MLAEENILKAEALSLLKEKDGIYSCMYPDFASIIGAYIPRFEEIRILEKEGFSFTPNEYEKLPFLESVKDNFEWKFRRQTLGGIKALLKNKKGLIILEIGSWNGWLTNQLAGMGHKVIATDYFLSEKDGLQSKRFYKNKWTALQTNLSDLSIFKEGAFDCIIMNHGLQFYTDPVGYADQLTALLKPGGIAILSGLSIYDKTAHREKKKEDFVKFYKNKYNFDIFFQPTKGYLDRKDKKLLESKGFVFQFYPLMLLRNAASFILRSKPSYYLAYHKKA